MGDYHFGIHLEYSFFLRKNPHMVSVSTYNSVYKQRQSMVITVLCISFYRCTVLVIALLEESKLISFLLHGNYMNEHMIPCYGSPLPFGFEFVVCLLKHGKKVNLTLTLTQTLISNFFNQQGDCRQFTAFWIFIYVDQSETRLQSLRKTKIPTGQGQLDRKLSKFHRTQRIFTDPKLLSLIMIILM